MKDFTYSKPVLKKRGYIFDFYQQEVEKNNTIHKFDLIKHNGAVAILLVDGDDFVLVEQFRYPLQRKIIEIVAGKIEKNEIDPLQTAIRECKEELGVEIRNIQFMDVITPSGGIYSEKIHIYVAQIKSYTLETNFDEFEDVKICKVNQHKALQWVFSNKIVDTKTVYAIMRYYNDWKKN